MILSDVGSHSHRWSDSHQSTHSQSRAHIEPHVFLPAADRLIYQPNCMIFNQDCLSLTRCSRRREPRLMDLSKSSRTNIPSDPQPEKIKFNIDGLIAKTNSNNHNSGINGMICVSFHVQDVINQGPECRRSLLRRPLCQSVPANGEPGHVEHVPCPSAQPDARPVPSAESQLCNRRLEAEGRYSSGCEQDRVIQAGESDHLRLGDSGKTDQRRYVA